MSTEALALRIAGHTPAHVARQFGYPTPAAASEAVREAIQRTGYAHLPEPHALHLLRLDYLAAVLAPRDDDEQPRRARLLARVQQQRTDALDALTAAALKRADKGRQIGGRP